jgi:hypothetical protein
MYKRILVPTLQLGGLALEPSLQNRGTIDDPAHIGGKPDVMIIALIRRVSYLVSSSRISLYLAVGTFSCVLSYEYRAAKVSDRCACVSGGIGYLRKQQQKDNNKHKHCYTIQAKKKTNQTSLRLIIEFCSPSSVSNLPVKEFKVIK